MGLGKFDYIDCCGVLHHLPDPAAGLAILRGALNDDGGIGLMVYGAFGRTGVYHLQEALRLLGATAMRRRRSSISRADSLKQLAADELAGAQSVPRRSPESRRCRHL